MADILETADDKTELVYLGTREGSNGKTHALWIMADELEALEPAAYNAALEKARWYTAKKDTRRTIGGRYEMKAQIEGERTSLWFGTAQYIGQSAHPLIAAFQADAAQERDREYRAKNEKKAQEPVYMRDMENTLAALKRLPRRQALDIANAIHIELRSRILASN